MSKLLLNYIPSSDRSVGCWGCSDTHPFDYGALLWKMCSKHVVNAFTVSINMGLLWLTDVKNVKCM